MVYKLIENENGDYRASNGIIYDLLEATNVMTPQGKNVGWTPFDSLEQAMIEFEVTHTVKTLEE